MKSTEVSFYVGSICWLLTCRLDGVNQQLQRSRPLMAQRDLAPKEGAMLLALLLLSRSEGGERARRTLGCVLRRPSNEGGTTKKEPSFWGVIFGNTRTWCCKRVRLELYFTVQRTTT